MADTLQLALDRLVDSVTLAYHRLTSASDALHAGAAVSTGQRAILLLLARRGPMTLSEIARDRGVSRQFVQRLAQDISRRGWIIAQANPHHRRSAKLDLTDEGRAAVEDLLKREAPLRTRMAASLRFADLKQVVETLDAASATLAETPPGAPAPRRRRLGK